EANPAILPLGEATSGAMTALKAVKAKVDDYFTRCQLASFDSRAVSALNREEKEYLLFTGKDLTMNAAEIAALPLPRAERAPPLPLAHAITPAWRRPIPQLRSDVLKPVLGDKPTLSEADWTALLGRFGMFECWSAGKAGAAVEKLGLKRLREILG